MSRSGYSDDCDSDYGVNPWPAIIKRAVQGKPGIAFLQELLAALDAIPDKRLIAEELITADGAMCALGTVGKARGIDMSKVDPEDYGAVAKTFGITETLAREVAFRNDDDFSYRQETPEQRWTRVRAWVVEQIGEAGTKAQNAEQWSKELADAGWIKQPRGRYWMAPDGKLWRGPYWAHHQMELQREGAKQP